jgi:glycosyltransferase involved in cell wall biosynthesis
MMGIRRAVGGSVPILAQHHGEPPATAMRSRIGQRLSRRAVDGYLFTGAAGQAEAFRRAGAISRSAPVHEVLESASHLDTAVSSAGPVLSGHPSVLWVGRLIPSKDPLCAVHAIAAARDRGSDAELHMLATDRTMEPEVLQLVGSLGLGDVVQLHPPVPHADVAGWYRGADVYLSTSRREGSNYSLIEALGFGCWPVVTDIPSHAAIVKDLSRRFAVGDAADAGLLLALGARAPRADVVDHSVRCLSWRSIAEQLVGTYRRAQKS